MPFEKHPYIRLFAILSYSGSFDGNGHQITWFQRQRNGNVCLSGTGMEWLRDLVFEAPVAYLGYGRVNGGWDMALYGELTEKIENCGPGAVEGPQPVYCGRTGWV